jgi:hypothetical protein
MLTEPVRREDLPDGAKVLMIERVEDDDENLRGIVFDLDKETGAASVDWIGDAASVNDIVDMLLYGVVVSNGYNSKVFSINDLWFPVEIGGCVRYLQSGEISVQEAALAAVGISALRSDPPPPSREDLLAKALEEAIPLMSEEAAAMAKEILAQPRGAGQWEP